jgi:hypothetical protein
MTVRNYANLVIRKVFAETNQMHVFRRIVYKAWSTAYQMTEEVGEFGSGTPSPLHHIFECVRELKEIGEHEGWKTNHALELATAPLDFYQLLCGGGKGIDAQKKTAFLSQCLGNASYLLNGRQIPELSIDEAGRYAAFMSDVATAGRELAMAAETHIANSQQNFKGQPEQGERLIVAR